MVVSIHHMLLFINLQDSDNGKIQDSFNTSHVTLYLFLRVFSKLTFIVSIHHMLLFIYIYDMDARAQDTFQYITCYSLSQSKRLKTQLSTCFNTSHVTLYRRTWIKTIPEECVSIHHMLLFIHTGETKKVIGKQFQYITCYSLSERMPLVFWWKRVSIHHMLLFIWIDWDLCRNRICFNTSHVTLYPYSETVYEYDYKFQYITCYSLSQCRKSKKKARKFQYITCYSLSFSAFSALSTDSGFQYITCYSLSIPGILFC